MMPRESPHPAPLDLREAPGHLIRRAQQVHQTIWAERIGKELTSVQFAILTLVASDPGLEQQEVGSRISIDTSTVADVCRRLASHSLIERRRDPADTRRRLLYITADGAAVLERTTPRVAEVGDELLAPLSRSEGETLLRLLIRVVERGA